MRAPHRLGAVLLAVGLTALVQAAPADLSGTPGTARLASAAAGHPRCDGKRATVVGTKRADRLEGTLGPDVIVGRGGGDRIDGGGGADVICGGGGADRIEGGSGSDRLHGGPDQLREGPGGSYLVGDWLQGGRGRDVLDGGADTRPADERRRPDTYSWADARHRVRVDLAAGTARGRGSDTLVVGPASGVVGSPRADRITGSEGADRVEPGTGNDHVDTGAGRDLVLPGGGRDVVVTGPGPDLVSSSAGRDQISTGRGDDFVEAFSDKPTAVRAGPGRDYVGQNVARGAGAVSDGGPGDDVVAFYGRLLAGPGQPVRFTVDYRHGTTRSSGDVATGTIAGFEGHRFVGPLEWSFFGTGGDDRVWAIGGGPLLARGYAGNDSFTGTPGRDLLAGGPGSDYAAGDGGKDRCRSIERGGC